MKKNREEHKIAYKIFKTILGFFYKLYYNPTIIGKEVIPEEGPIILAGNHVHLYDQNAVILSTKRMVHYMAKIEYFQDKKVAWFFKASGCIPVDRQAHDGKAKAKAIEILKNNYALGIFPEGTRNKTDQFLLPFKKGAVKMAQETEATIVPFAITGDYKFRSKNLTLRYGKPFKVGPKDDIEKANEKLYKEVERLKKESLKSK